MDYKRTNAPLNTVTRDLNKMAEQTGNVYESVCIIARRANEIAVEIKKTSKRNFRNSLPATTWKRLPKPGTD